MRTSLILPRFSVCRFSACFQRPKALYPRPWYSCWAGVGGWDGTQVKLELGSRRTESGGENIVKRKGFKEGGKSMLFILKKKKEKKIKIKRQ